MNYFFFYRFGSQSNESLGGEGVRWGQFNNIRKSGNLGNYMDKSFIM